MKNNLKKLALFATLSTSLFFVNCSSDSDSDSNTIVSIASDNSEFSSLVAAIERAGLTSTLDGSGNFTVFAPTNAAFASFLNANGFATLNDVPVPLLKEVLLNHVINDEFFSNELSTSYVKTLGKGAASTTNTLSMYVKVTGSAVKLNGVSNVTGADIDASNGVIHKVDAVIGLPTVVSHAVANTDFSTLVTALTASDNITNFVSVLSGTASSPFTVFAPTNAAFTGLLTELGAPSLTSIPVDVRDSVLKYHVVAGANVLSTSLTNNQNVQMLSGSGASNAVTVLLSPARLRDANDRMCNIVATDVQCANGVIHVLDKVLLPGE